MTRSITKFPAVDIRVADTGGGHFNIHVVAGKGQFFSLNDGDAKQLYLALKELFGSEDDAKVADLLSLAQQYHDDLKYGVAEDSKKRRIERIKEVVKNRV